MTQSRYDSHHAWFLSFYFIYFLSSPTPLPLLFLSFFLFHSHFLPTYIHVNREWISFLGSAWHSQPPVTSSAGGSPYKFTLNRNFPFCLYIIVFTAFWLLFSFFYHLFLSRLSLSIFQVASTHPDCYILSISPHIF